MGEVFARTLKFNMYTPDVIQPAHSLWRLLACGMLLACDPGVPTQVLVTFDASDGMRMRATSVRITTSSITGEPRVRQFTIGDGGQLQFPFTQPLEPLNGDASRPFTITAELLDSGSQIFAQQVAIGGYVEGELRAVNLFFEDSCDGVLCEGTGTCVEGRCQPACVTAVVLPEPRARTPSNLCGAFRKPLLIDRLTATESFQDFPLLVVLSADADLAAGASVGGLDIGFVDDTGEFLDHELESFDKETGALIAWVRVPTLLAGVENRLQMIWGGPPLPNNTERVWREYRGVWHFGETDSAVHDSTVFAVQGVSNGTPGVVGQVGLAYRNEGVVPAVTFGDPDDGHLDFTSNESFAMTAWAKFDAAMGQTFLYKGGANDTTPGYQLSVTGEPGRFVLSSVVRDNADRVQTSAVGLTAGVWHHVAAVINQEDDSLSVYIDGRRAESRGGVRDVDPNEGERPQSLRLGFDIPLFGDVDEVRIRGSALSDAWLAAEHENQRDPSGFIAIGDAQPIQ